MAEGEDGLALYRYICEVRRKRCWDKGYEECILVKAIFLNEVRADGAENAAAKSFDLAGHVRSPDSFGFASSSPASQKQTSQKRACSCCTCDSWAGHCRERELCVERTLGRQIREVPCGLGRPEHIRLLQAQPH